MLKVLLEELPADQREVVAVLWLTIDDPTAIIAQMKNTIATRFVWQALTSQIPLGFKPRGLRE